MRNKLVIAAAFSLAALFLAVPAQAGDNCRAAAPCAPAKPVCKCVTISAADFAACGGAWYASTSEGWKSPMFRSRSGCVCTYRSNTWSFVGKATNQTYLWDIWVGR